MAAAFALLSTPSVSAQHETRSAEVETLNADVDRLYDYDFSIAVAP